MRRTLCLQVLVDENNRNPLPAFPSRYAAVTPSSDHAPIILTHPPPPSLAS